ncbi:FtsW/RodA/SpoVE family cell cycle protein [Clostridium sp. DL1XJH146]
MNKFISKFLSDVCTEVKYKEVHPELANELQGHIEELKNEYIENGMNEDEGIKKAVQQMGDPFEIGKKLNKTHRPKTEWSIVALIIAMVFIGVITLLSLSSSDNINLSYKAYIMYLIIGFVACIGCYFFDYTKLKKYSLHIFVATLVFLFFSSFFSIRVNGMPYLRIGPFSIITSILFIPLFLLSFAGLLNNCISDSVNYRKKLMGISFLAIISIVLIAGTLQSMPNAIFLSCGYIAILGVAGNGKDFKGNRKEFLLIIYCGVIGFIGVLFFYLLNNPYMHTRLLSFINYASDPNGSGYINSNLNKMLSGSKLIGKSEALYINVNGINSFAIPEMNTEFAFAYIVSAFGWIAAGVVMIVFVLTFSRMFLATRKIHSSYGKLISVAIITVFSLQVITSILMNLGLFPITGISLPFISYGGSNFVSNMILLGLLLSVYRRKDLVGVYS